MKDEYKAILVLTLIISLIFGPPINDIGTIGYINGFVDWLPHAVIVLLFCLVAVCLIKLSEDKEIK